MKKIKRWVYYCEFCKKGGRSSYHMQKHEKSCTKNPDRYCGMCGYGDGTPQAKMSNMLEALKIAKIEEKEESLEHIGGIDKWISVQITNEKEAVENLRKVANGCPACMLAAIRQTTDYPMVFCSFNFKEQQKIFWYEYNSSLPDPSPY